jgi:hypothetical protein
MPTVPSPYLGQEGGQRSCYSMCRRGTGVDRVLEKCDIASPPPIHPRTLKPPHPRHNSLGPGLKTLQGQCLCSHALISRKDELQLLNQLCG